MFIMGGIFIYGIFLTNYYKLYSKTTYGYYTTVTVKYTKEQKT